LVRRATPSTGTPYNPIDPTGTASAPNAAEDRAASRSISSARSSIPVNGATSFGLHRGSISRSYLIAE
jgi:hypothetical protein